MAISIDWPNRIITVPRLDMTLVQSTPTEIRQLDLNSFRLELKELEETDAGMTYPDTHRHNTEVTVGGVTLARVIEIINGYTVTFEDGTYAVNLFGANSNVADVTNVNQVSVRSANSAGLTSPGFEDTADRRLREIWQIHGLDADNPMVVNQNSRTAGDIDQTFTEDDPTPGDIKTTRNP